MWITAAALAMVAVMSTACSSSRDPGNANTSTTPATETQSFTSDRLGYELEVPEGWTAKEGYIDWTMGAPPHRGSPPFDTFSSPNGDPWIVVGQQAVGADTTLAQWVKQLRATNTITYPDLCEPPDSEGATSLGGEPAHSVAIRCPKDFPMAVGIEILAVHDSSGFLVLCYSEEEAKGDIPAFESDCDQWRESFRFLA